MSHPTPPIADGGDIVLFAKVPLRLSEANRIAQFDRPLAASFAAAGAGSFIRGFSPVGQDGDVMYVGLEVSVGSLAQAAEFATRLLELGAPNDSRIEYENDLAAIEFSLAEATGG
jgi:hypothetical protein